MSKSKERPGCQPTDETLSLDTIHDLLSASRRRYTLYCLYLYENPVHLPVLAERVTEWAQREPQVPEDRRQTYIGLYHNHIPKLADANVVAYYQAEDMIELSGNGTQLRPYLEQAAETDLNANDTATL